MAARPRADGGFTVIELLIAFTILAIVSGSLFQVFYVASANNAQASERDMANSLAIAAVELFKAEPERGAADAGTVYYDAGWNELLSVGAREAWGGAAPEGAAFVMEKSVGKTDAAMPAGSGYMAGASELALGAQENYRIVISEGGAGGVEILFNGVPQPVDGGRAQKSIPVSLVFSDRGILPKNVVVVNNTGMTANINVFGVPKAAGASGAGGVGAADGSAGGNETAGADGGTAATNADGGTGEANADGGTAATNADGGTAAANLIDMQSAYVNVSAAEGSVGVTYFSGGNVAPESMKYSYSVSIRRIGEDDAELARLEAQKYVPG